MKRNWMKVTALCMTAAVVCCGLSGCKKTEKAAGSGEITYAADGKIYPMQCEDTLSLWIDMGAADNGQSGMEATPFGKAWMEQTGVNVEFMHPTAGSTEQLSLTIASGDLPDIMIANIAQEPGGVTKYAKDGVIIDLTDNLEKFSPTYWGLLKSREDIDKMSKSDDGRYYGYNMILNEKELRSTCGFIVRKDILDQAGLPVPETIDEWTAALRAYKANGATAPLSYDIGFWEQYGGMFTGAYGTKMDFYLDDNGKVRYGFLDAGMKDVFALFADWYKEGLLDQDIAKIADEDARVTNSNTCAYAAWASSIAKFTNAMKGKNPNVELVAAKFPVLQKGDTSKFGIQTAMVPKAGAGYITTNCKNVELAMRFLDYGYTEAGHILMNFGEEGESYTMVDGKPKYTEVITNNPEGLSMSQVMGRYLRGNTSGPFVQDLGYLQQYYPLPQQQDAVKTWSECDAEDRAIPNISMTEDESTEVSSIMNPITTYTSESLYKFIMGVEPMSNYETFVEKIKSMNIDRAIEIYQAAVDRYNKR